MELVFWISLAIVIYTYLGYGIIISIIAFFKEKKQHYPPETYEPNITLFVAAYNELAWLEQKIKNFQEIDYPKEKIQILFITDGSDDGSVEFLKKQIDVECHHIPTRGGKVGALNRGYQFVKNEIIIYSDANTALNKNCIKNIVRHFNDPSVGCVAGEKRIKQSNLDNASGAGEGLYWKYESFLKQKDDKVYSCIGAAGELFAIRKSLHEHIEPDTILDDFIISMKIVLRGYKIKYEPNAYALENPSENIHEEMKRKIRISAGGIQSILKLPELMNIRKHPMLSFQYISHRVMRWTITPLLLPLLLILNLQLAIQEGIIYQLLLTFHLLFYTMAFLGYWLKKRKFKFKKLFIPFYFLFMNYAVFAGMYRYWKGSQSAIWEKSKRAQ